MKETKKKKGDVAGKIKDPAYSCSEVSENGNKLGTIKIHANVIASVIRKATLSVEGVSRLAGNTLVDNIAEIVGSRKIHDRAITVDMEDDTVRVEVKVNIVFGAHIPSVAENIQTSIIREVEDKTGKKVTSVDVVIQEIEEVKAEEPEETESDE